MAGAALCRGGEVGLDGAVAHGSAWLEASWELREAPESKVVVNYIGTLTVCLARRVAVFTPSRMLASLVKDTYTDRIGGWWVLATAPLRRRLLTPRSLLHPTLCLHDRNCRGRPFLLLNRLA